MFRKIVKTLIPRSLFRSIEPYGHLVEAVLANLAYRFPARKLRVVGITGTNGKTTTAVLVGGVLEAGGHKVGISSTALFQVAGKRYDNELNMTVTNAFALQKLLRQMVKAKCEFAVVEMTSHALAQNRVWGVKPEVAVLTNLTHDHLDYHGTMERYAAAKMKLFQMGPALIVLNKDDKYYEQFAAIPAAWRLSYGVDGGDVQAKNIKLTEHGSWFEITSDEKPVTVNLHLPGQFNVYNALAAAAVGLGLGASANEVKRGLESVKAVPGRTETIEEGQKFAVVVDFAHAPDALEKVLTALRGSTEGRLINVFGGFGGNHDLSKFTPMGQIAGKLSDVVIVTDDEPYDDDPAMLRRLVATGVKQTRVEMQEIPDRREAFATAFAMAKPGDTVVITGMGHQKFRQMAGGKVAWDDRQVAREELKKLHG